MPEWTIENVVWMIHPFQIIHNHCNERKRVFVWDMYNSLPDPNSLWSCLGCRQKAPNHIILQWKIIYGK